MRLASVTRGLGIILLLSLFTGGYIVAQEAVHVPGGDMFAFQEECEEVNALGTPVIHESATPATPASDIEIGPAGTPHIGEDVGEIGAPGTIAVSNEDEGFLCQDIDGDGIPESGIDEDLDGTLDENEVVGPDLGITVDMGDDNVLDPTDEGYLREDVDGDGTFEIGIDEDQSGTLEENEVVGTDVNEDEALTEEEVGT